MILLPMRNTGSKRNNVLREGKGSKKEKNILLNGSVEENVPSQAKSFGITLATTGNAERSRTGAVARISFSSIITKSDYLTSSARHSLKDVGLHCVCRVSSDFCSGRELVSAYSLMSSFGHLDVLLPLCFIFL